MTNRIDFNIDSKRPYLTQVVGLSDELIKYFKRYPSTYPMKIKNNEITILTSDIIVFIKRLKKMSYSNIYESRQEYNKIKKQHVVIKDSAKVSSNDIKFCIEENFNDIYFELLHKKYKMTYKSADPRECFTLSKMNLFKLKKKESDYIKFVNDKVEEEDEEKDEEEKDREEEKEKDKEEEKEKYKEEEKEKEENQQGWFSYISNMFGFGTPFIQNDLSNFFGDKSGHSKYTGKYAWQWGWLLYLQKELGNNLVCVWKGDTGEGGIFFNKYGKNYLEVSDWVVGELNRCIKDVQSKFTIGIMTIKTRNYINHANALIFDRETKRLLRFEPHGGETNSYDSVLLDLELSRWLKKNFGKDWTYKPPNSFCPIVGPQTKEVRSYYYEKMEKTYKNSNSKDRNPIGYCSAWSLLFLHYRLMNPSLSEEQIVKYMVSHSSDVLADKIREYVTFISKTIDPNWYSNKKKEALSIGDDVEFKQMNVRTEYGRILRKDENHAIVFSINYLEEKKDGETSPYKIYAVEYEDLELLSNDLGNEKDVRKIIRQKMKTYGSIVNKLKK